MGSICVCGKGTANVHRNLLVTYRLEHGDLGDLGTPEREH